MIKYSVSACKFLLLGSLSLLSLTSCTAKSTSQSSLQAASSTNVASLPSTQSSSPLVTATTINTANLNNNNPESVAVETAASQPKLSQSQPPQVADADSSSRHRDTQVNNSEPTEFKFFVEREMENDPRVIKLLGHPCGVTAITRVTIMPDVDSKDFMPDKVVEIPPPSRDLRSLAGSTTLRRWAKPIDSEVIAIEGDRILVDVGQDRFYWIEPSGKFQLQSSPISAPKPELDKTDLGKHPEFINSSYARRWRFKDLKSGQERVIIYEANCT